MIKPGKGTYEIRDFTIIFHYEDGVTTKHRILLDVIEMSEIDYSAGIISPKQIYLRHESARYNYNLFQ